MAALDAISARGVKLYGGTFTTHASNRQAGVINIYVLAALNDTPTWPATARPVCIVPSPGATTC